MLELTAAAVAWVANWAVHRVEAGGWRRIEGFVIGRGGIANPGVHAGAGDPGGTTR
jgi:hypothetical protein